MSWQTDLLQAIGAPSGPGAAGQANIKALTAWADSEGNPSSYNNWLSVSGRFPGAGKCIAQCGSTSPIYTYDTEADGVAATASFMKGSYYTAVIKAFQQSNGNLPPIFTAINQSKWCSGCQGGQYPSVLYKVVGGAALPTTGLGSLVPGGGSVPDIGAAACNPVIKVATVTLIDSCQAKELLGGLLIGVGALAMIVGLGVVLADVGLRKSAPAILGAVIGRRSGQRSAQQASERRVAEATQISEARASSRRYGRGEGGQPSAADRERFRREGFENQ